MSKTLFAFAAAGAALFAGAPAMAQSSVAISAESRADAAASPIVFTEENSHWRDYQTDLSEARRELRSDLRRAHDADDRVDAYAEYEREVADARHDFRKEMAERGVLIRDEDMTPTGTVTVEEVAMIEARDD
ncbi:hypothetical protein [Stakelama tenebrarum]|uniref:DUF4148 domain-containing protein n=1 Tax=Stakelama tenebrarum TaxID=2711215 RepID=A0A6G6Y319_9SPHN|nr:hypothetical protein [Sphingosinithalassobacter tenebrarum]QIG78966.1 hypothetical protein G5C33_03645 [Sphingosinithalassobacter tenebrarum]